MISLANSTVELNPNSVYESLVANLECKDSSMIDVESWNKFATFLGIQKSTKNVRKTSAIRLIDEYIAEKDCAIEKISQFFGWVNSEKIDQYLLLSEKLLMDMSEKYSDDWVYTKKVKFGMKFRIVSLPNGWYIAVMYDKDNTNINSIHISVEKSEHKTAKGTFDMAEVGYFKDKICVNLDTSSSYNDEKGYNSFYELDIKNNEYDFEKYVSMANKILELADN